MIHAGRKEGILIFKCLVNIRKSLGAWKDSQRERSFQASEGKHRVLQGLQPDRAVGALSLNGSGLQEISQPTVIKGPLGGKDCGGFSIIPWSAIPRQLSPGCEMQILSFWDFVRYIDR